MASRASTHLKALRSRVLLISTTLGAATLGFKADELRRRRGNGGTFTPAEEQFHTSSMHPVPHGWTGRTWSIRNDYPMTAPNPATLMARKGDDVKAPPPLPSPATPRVGSPRDDAPWLDVDFKLNPLLYCAVVKEYCWEGNVHNGFVVQKNTVRNWYHAPWLHYSDKGREPLNGLTFERPIPAFEFSRTQGRYLQTWACGYYNSPGASVFGKVWANPALPQWNGDLKFPEGTCVFKILLTDATDKEIPTMGRSPALQAVIAQSNADPVNHPAHPAKRNTFASELRLLQVDFAVRDDRAPTGWVFGAFLYNGNSPALDPWDRIIPVGLTWGNDPTINQAAFDAGQRPTESWINPEAEKLRLSLGGTRPFWGWNGRLAGPVDDFVSSCTSCHSVAQKTGNRNLTQPAPKLVNSRYVPVDDKRTMNWFRNLPSGMPFDPGAESADYSLQLVAGYNNYHKWLEAERSALPPSLRGVVYTPGKAFRFDPRDRKEKR